MSRARQHPCKRRRDPTKDTDNVELVPLKNATGPTDPNKQAAQDNPGGLLFGISQGGS